ncbi:hypothetical protein CFIMG_001248RA [Ceratocystis fimbriata CBS 114723]|uniref:Uncharacterized protein n=1 Tax=Ceratocystis fimbriata CBS 114723 TaxID=1035309 RepID=A0A2C5X4Z6_9PEZI|nr:hypothetical protein CFIMG_001248RA [Ceratocystis fimbriata CBS 114723]
MHLRSTISTVAAVAGTAATLFDAGFRWPHIFPVIDVSAPSHVHEHCAGLVQQNLVVVKHAPADFEAETKTGVGARPLPLPLRSWAETCCPSPSMSCNTSIPLLVPLGLSDSISVSQQAERLSLYPAKAKTEKAQVSEDNLDSPPWATVLPSAAKALPEDATAAFPAGKLLLTTGLELNSKLHIELQWLCHKLHVFSTHLLHSLRMAMAVDQASGSNSGVSRARQSPSSDVYGSVESTASQPSSSLVAALDAWAYEPRIKCSSSDVGLLLSLGSLVSISMLMGALLMPEQSD